MQLTEHIYLIGSGRDGFGLTHPSDCHVYVIDGGDEIGLIDAGAGVDIVPVLQRLGRTGLSPDRIRRLFITHAHADHAGGSAKLRRALSVGIIASREVATILRSGDEAAASVDVGKAQGTYEPQYRLEAASVDAEVADGDLIQVGKLRVEVVATPGHSTGHHSYLVESETRRDLFTGDALLFGGKIILQDTWDCDLRAYIQSLRRLGEYRFDGLFPGHFTFSASDGERHVQVALNALERGLIPPTLSSPF